MVPTADTKIGSLPSLSGDNAAGADVVPVADVSASATKGITLTELVAAIVDVIGVGLDDLSDVTVEAPTESDALLYDGSIWSSNAIAAAVVVVDPDGLINSSSTDVQEVIVDFDSAIVSAVGTGIPSTIFDAAGDLVVGSAADTPAKLAKGSNYTFLGVTGAGAVAYADPRSVPQTVNTQTGTTYTGVLTDAGKLVTLSNASTITLTVPPAADVAYPAGTVIDIAQYGAGQVTVVGGSGVTVNTSSTLKLRTQWSTASLILTATANTWVIVGDLEPLGQAINAQTGTTYAPVLADGWKLITLSNAAAITMTIPANASVAFPVGTHIDLMQLGAGQVTVAITSDTLRSTPTAKLRAQYSMATLVKIASTTWVISGDMALS